MLPGRQSATTAVHLGAQRVAIVEQGPLWGTCLNNGCIPSKFLISVSDIHYYRNYGHPGLSVESNLNLPAVLQEKQRLLDRLRSRKKERIFEDLGIDLINGTATFFSPHDITVGEKRISAGKFIIAAGSRPFIPDIEGIHTVPYRTNIEALEPDTIPGALLVIGGRALGLEFAQVYAHFGSSVAILQRSPTIIPEEEPAIAALMEEYLRAEGISIITGVTLEKVRTSGSGIAVSTRMNGSEREFAADAILVATGRVANTRELNPDAAGVKTGKNGIILVDRNLRTSAPHIWAAGDVLGKPQLEPVATIGGIIAAENALVNKDRTLDLSSLPHAIFTTPQVASVGLTESQAKARGIPVTCRSVPMDATSKSQLSGDSRGMIKIVAEEPAGAVLGVHICAPLAAEMIQEAVFAVKYHLTVRDIIDTFHVYPSFAGAIQLCARSFFSEISETGPCS